MTLLARTVGLLSWRVPRLAAARFRSFALAEEGSMIDLRIAARLTPSPARAAAYLAHASDEGRHARVFSRHARDWAERAGAPAPAPAHADVEHLFETLGERDFLALVHRGEARACAELEIYRRDFERRGEARTAQVLAGVLADERRHAETSRALLLEVAGSEGDARRALLRMALREAWRSYRRAGAALAGRLYALFAMLLYLLAAPLGLAMRLSSRAPRGFAPEGGGERPAG